jgi:hypothetical protein
MTPENTKPKTKNQKGKTAMKKISIKWTATVYPVAITTKGGK